jgi:hypothetical protein
MSCNTYDAAYANAVLAENPWLNQMDLRDLVTLVALVHENTSAVVSDPADTMYGTPVKWLAVLSKLRHGKRDYTCDGECTN